MAQIAWSQSARCWMNTKCPPSPSGSPSSCFAFICSLPTFCCSTCSLLSSSEFSPVTARRPQFRPCPSFSPFGFSVLSHTVSHSRRFRTTLTKSGNFSATSWSGSTTAGLQPLHLWSSSTISTSLSGFWSSGSSPPREKSFVSAGLYICAFIKGMHSSFKGSNVPRTGNISHWCSEIELSISQEEELLSWEALMKDRYLVSLQQKQNENTERRIQETVQKYKTLHSSAAQCGCLTRRRSNEFNFTTSNVYQNIFLASATYADLHYKQQWGSNNLVFLFYLC